MVRVNGACHQFQPAVTTFRIEHADTGIETPRIAWIPFLRTAPHELVPVRVGRARVAGVFNGDECVDLIEFGLVGGEAGDARVVKRVGGIEAVCHPERSDAQHVTYFVGQQFVDVVSAVRVDTLPIGEVLDFVDVDVDEAASDRRLTGGLPTGGVWGRTMVGLHSW